MDLDLMGKRSDLCIRQIVEMKWQVNETVYRFQDILLRGKCCAVFSLSLVYP
jgi:hypothetical protein